MFRGGPRVGKCPLWVDISISNGPPPE